MSPMQVHCAHSAVMDVAQLVPNPRNPNRHPDAQIQMLAKIMAYQGWRSPIVISKRSGFIVKGHGRLAAALLALRDVGSRGARVYDPFAGSGSTLRGAYWKQSHACLKARAWLTSARQRPCAR